MKWSASLGSLRNRSLRIFFVGQAVSLLGTWFQLLAASWFVYRTTHSAEMLGLVAFVGQVPLALLSIPAGMLADRWRREHILVLSNGVAMGQAVVLAILGFGHWLAPWHVAVLSFVSGACNAIEVPALQGLLSDLAGSRHLKSAVAMNSVLVNCGRLVGPSIAGVAVAALGESWCFVLNALSYVFVLTAVGIIAARRAGARSPGAPQKRGGVSLATRVPIVRGVLVLAFVASLLALPYTVLMPLIAGSVLGGGPALLGRLMGAAGTGAFVAAVGLLIAPGVCDLTRRVGIGCLCLSIGLLGMSLSRTPEAMMVWLFLTGFGFINQMAGTMTLIQEQTPAATRGRVVGIFMTVFAGTTPFGALLMGECAAHLSPLSTVRAGAALTLVAGVVYFANLRRARATRHAAA